MALVLHEIKDSDFEYIVKVTTTGTNSAASILDASDAEGASPISDMLWAWTLLV